MNKLIKSMYDYQCNEGALQEDAEFEERKELEILQNKVKELVGQDMYFQLEYLINGQVVAESKKCYEQGVKDGLSMLKEA